MFQIKPTMSEKQQPTKPVPMSIKYVPKYTKETLEEALDAVKVRKMSINHASIVYKVPKSMLRSKVNGTTTMDCAKGSPCALGKEAEAELVNTLTKRIEEGNVVVRKHINEEINKMLKENPKLKRKAGFGKHGPHPRYGVSIYRRHPELVLKMRASQQAKKKKLIRIYENPLQSDSSHLNEEQQSGIVSAIQERRKFVLSQEQAQKESEFHIFLEHVNCHNYFNVCFCLHFVF